MNSPLPVLFPVLFPDIEYQVECIVTHRGTNRKGDLAYLVQWVGYDSKNNTWEPSTTFGSSLAVQIYYESIEENSWSNTFSETSVE